MNLPNKLTVARVIAVPFFIAFYMLGYHIAAFVIFIAASLTDMLDGKIARKRGLVTTFGKFVDPLADKLINLAAIILIAVHISKKGSAIYGVFATVTALVIVSREVIITSFRALAASEGTVIAADKLGKIKTVFQDIAIVALFLDASVLSNIPFAGELLHWTGAAMLAAALALTILSGINYFAANRELVSKIKEDI